MKGLLLKDYYTVKSKHKLMMIFYIIFGFFVGMSTVTRAGYFICVTNVIPYLFSDDKVSGWSDYSRTMPYSEKATVSSRFIFEAVYHVVFTVLFFMGRALYMVSSEKFSLISLIASTATAYAYLAIGSSLMLLHKFAQGKVMKAVLSVILTVFLVVLMVETVYPLFGDINYEEKVFPPSIVLVGMIIYGVIWLLSMAVYKKQIRA